MKLLSFKFAKIFCVFFLYLIVGHSEAHATPEIKGMYSGSYTIVVANCIESSDNGTYSATLNMTISEQVDNTFSGTATGTFILGNNTFTENIQLIGTITETGQISGTSSHTFVDSGGEGTFTGQLTEDMLSINNPGQDTYGDSCTYERSISTIRYGVTIINEIMELLPSDGVDNNRFGNSVSISGDTILVGAEGDDELGLDAGAAYIFRWNGTSWIEEQKLLPSDGEPNDRFGSSVAIYENLALVGAHLEDDNGLDSGAAYIFRWNGNNWIEEQKLLPSDGVSHENFGKSVAINGETILIGSPSGLFTNSIGRSFSVGSAYIFRKNSNVWEED
ncbi:MAG: FG-GAP repeat protein [bacterium]